MKALNWIFAVIGAALAAVASLIGLVAPSSRQGAKSLSQRLADSVTQSAALANDCSDYGTAFIRLSTIR